MDGWMDKGRGRGEEGGEGVKEEGIPETLYVSPREGNYYMGHHLAPC
jgi:hypothetical protein